MMAFLSLRHSVAARVAAQAERAIQFPVSQRTEITAVPSQNDAAVRELQHYSSIVIRMTEEHVALPDESDELLAPAPTMPLLP